MRRSQLATIVMAGINDVGGVCVGGVLGHLICTGLAVICGALIAKRIPVRMVTLLGNMSENWCICRIKTPFTDKISKQKKLDLKHLQDSLTFSPGALVFIGFAIASLFIDPYEENHHVPDVDGDDHNSTIFLQNSIEFVSTTEISV